MLGNQDGKADDHISEQLKVKSILKCKKKKFFSFAFNANSTLLFVGSAMQMELLEFNNAFKFLQILKVGGSTVTQILLLKKSNLLTLGNDDGQIFIYEMNNQWKLYQEFQNITAGITCIVTNENEDLIIVGREDGTINIWKKINLIWNSLQTIRPFLKISNLSLNSSGTILVCCGGYCDIAVIEFQNNTEWNIIQQIMDNNYYINVHFISENQFVITKKKEIQIYEMKEKQFILHKQQLLKKCPRCLYIGKNQFINQNYILIIKQECFINYFQKVQNQDSMFQQSVKLSCKTLISRVADSGQFLVSWNYDNKTSINYMSQIIQVDFIKL